MGPHSVFLLAAGDHSRRERNSAHGPPYPWNKTMSSRHRDRVFVNSLRETYVILAGFVVFLAWTIGVSYWLGYGETGTDTPDMVWGMPRWVFWGVFLPWLAADAFTIWFCFAFMADDDLSESSSAEPTTRAPHEL